MALLLTRHWYVVCVASHLRHLLLTECEASVVTGVLLQSVVVYTGTLDMIAPAKNVANNIDKTRPPDSKAESATLVQVADMDQSCPLWLSSIDDK